MKSRLKQVRIVCGVMAVAFAGVVWPVSADSCIYSGSTSRQCSYEAYGVLGGLDSFCWWLVFGDPLAEFTSYPPAPLMLLFR